MAGLGRPLPVSSRDRLCCCRLCWPALWRLDLSELLKGGLNVQGSQLRRLASQQGSAGCTATLPQADLMGICLQRISQLPGSLQSSGPSALSLLLCWPLVPVRGGPTAALMISLMPDPDRELLPRPVLLL